MINEENINTLQIWFQGWDSGDLNVIWTQFDDTNHSNVLNLNWISTKQNNFVISLDFSLTVLVIDSLNSIVWISTNSLCEVDVNTEERWIKIAQLIGRASQVQRISKYREIFSWVKSNRQEPDNENKLVRTWLKILIAFYYAE